MPETCGGAPIDDEPRDISLPRNAAVGQEREGYFCHDCGAAWTDEGPRHECPMCRSLHVEAACFVSCGGGCWHMSAEEARRCRTDQLDEAIATTPERRRRLEAEPS